MESEKNDPGFSFLLYFVVSLCKIFLCLALFIRKMRPMVLFLQSALGLRGEPRMHYVMKATMVHVM